MHSHNRAGRVLLSSLTALAVIAGAGGTSLAEPTKKPKDAWRTLDPVVRETNRGVALMERYAYAEAAKAFKQALDLAPDSREARVNLAIALWNRNAKGDLQQAEKLLDEVLADDPYNARASYFRGITHQYSGRDEQAIPCFQRALESQPHDAYAWYMLARSKSHLGQPCRTELDQAVRQNPALASAHYDLLRLAALEGNQAEVQRHQATFMKLRQSPLAEMVTIPHYRRMGPLAVVWPMPTTTRRSVTSGDLSAGKSKTILKATAKATVQDLNAKEQAATAGKLPARHGIQLALADVNSDGRLDMVTTAVVRVGPKGPVAQASRLCLLSRDDGATRKTTGETPVPQDAGATRTSGHTLRYTRRGVSLLLQSPDGSFTDVTASSGLAEVKGAISCAFGDYDNDDKIDLFVSCAGPNHLFRGAGAGTFKDVTQETGTAGPDAVTMSAVFLDADHDGDLDIYVCNRVTTDGAAPAPNQLLRNNADTTFTDIATEAGVACPTDRSLMLAPADIDGDRDTDLVVFNQQAPARIFFNDRLGRYHQEQLTAEPILGDHGGIMQDFNGDGAADLLVSPGPGRLGGLYLTDAAGAWKTSKQFEACVRAATSWGCIRTTRVADVDLDGDLDVVLFASEVHVLLNDGWGRFVSRRRVWPMPHDVNMIGAALADLTGDGLPDLLRTWTAADGSINLLPTKLSPPANWLAILPTGHRGTDKRTRSPASGFGTKVELRCGLHGQVITYTGLNGGLSQSRLPLIMGLNGATKADYLTLTWPDGVTQCENALAAGTLHRLTETERRVSSCPVLFAWDGDHFTFVGDFAGVGGLGYFLAPGQYAPPQPLEQVRIESHQLVAKDGLYQLRVCEPMEEVAYIDRLELIAIDHPRGYAVYPDERLAVSGPPPTHRLLCIADPIFPVMASGPDGIDCAESLAEVDRRYAYQPPLDRRFIGFCRPHTLLLEFDARVADSPPDKGVYLFLTGSIEYPYSQTTFAAAQAGITWQPLRIECRTNDGPWQTIAADAGAPGGIGRTIAINLTSKLPSAKPQTSGSGIPASGAGIAPGRVGILARLTGSIESRAASCGTAVSAVGTQARRLCHKPEPSLTHRLSLRITTNLEIYYDQAFIAADLGAATLTIRTIPLAAANLRRLGFPMEYSPDGRHPTIYTYDLIEPTSTFRIPSGQYTRYGPVHSLLTDFDDRYVILGTGDEIALTFDARRLPPPTKGETRTFILRSHAYCKDMDLYTAAPDTVGPLPFRSMSAYPYPPGELHPDQGQPRPHHQFNTRRVP